MRRNIEHREKNRTHILVQVLGKGKKKFKTETENENKKLQNNYEDKKKKR